eukprot:gene10708-12409_t
METRPQPPPSAPESPATRRASEAGPNDSTTVPQGGADRCLPTYSDLSTPSTMKISIQMMMLSALVLTMAACMLLAVPASGLEETIGGIRKLLQFTERSDNRCGAGFETHCGTARCCSQFSFCGGTNEFCGEGCQRDYGACN